MFNPSRIRPGDPITAANENATNDEVRRLGTLRGDAGIDVRDGGISLNLPERIYIKLTSSANGDGGYAWKEVYPAALRTWVDSGRTGSASVDPAYAIDGSLVLTSGNTIYRAERGVQSLEWLFE